MSGVRYWIVELLLLLLIGMTCFGCVVAFDGKSSRCSTRSMEFLKEITEKILGQMSTVFAMLAFDVRLRLSSLTFGDQLNFSAFVLKPDAYLIT